MTIDEAKERLRRPRKLTHEMRSICLEVERLEAIGTQTTTALQYVKSRPTNKVESKVEQAAVAVVDYQASLTGKIQAILREYTEIEGEIDSLDDPELRAVLRYYYLAGLNWEKICAEMNYSWQGIHNKHNEALKEYTKLDCFVLSQCDIMYL